MRTRDSCCREREMRDKVPVECLDGQLCGECAFSGGGGGKQQFCCVMMC